MNKLLLTITILITVNSLLGMDPTSYSTKVSKDKSLYELRRTGPEKKETQPSPITFFQLYYHFAYNVFSPEVTQQIFSFHCTDINFTEISDKLKQNSNPKNYKSPEHLVKYMKELICSHGYLLTSEVCEQFFKDENISICDIKDHFKDTCLHVNNNPNITRILIKIAGKKAWELLTIQNYDDCTALHYTAFSRRTKNAKALLDAAGDKAYELITMQDENGCTALHYAACKYEIEQVELFLAIAGDRAGELIAMQNNAGQTTLHTTAMVEEKEIKDMMKLLIKTLGEEKANELMWLEDKSGKTAFGRAIPEIKAVMRPLKAFNEMFKNNYHNF